MNKVYITILVMLFSMIVLAQSPEKISYQAIIRNSENNLVTNQQVGMQISILKGAVANTATPVYSEIQTVTTNANGLVSVEIGMGTSSNDFSTIDWGNGIFYIKTETDLNGGTDYTITGTSQLLSVPFALYAAKAGNVPDIEGLATQKALEDTAINLRSSIPTESDFAQIEDIPTLISELSNDVGYITRDTTLNEAEVDAFVSNNGYATKDMGNEKITNLGTPTLESDAVNKAYVDELKEQIEELKLSLNLIVKDIDGNIYNTVTIGNQIWMKENLKTTCLNDSTILDKAVENIDWNSSSPIFGWYNNEINYNNTYGALYNWYSVNTGKICPIGWHVPSDEDFKELELYLGMDSLYLDSLGFRGINEGSKLKNTNGWGNNGNGTNESGFSALPGGTGNMNAYFDNGTEGNWWSSTTTLDVEFWAIIRTLNNGSDKIKRTNLIKSAGISVRCLKD